MDINGKAVKRLTTGGRDSFAAWSPDGRQIAFLRPTGAKWSVYVVSASGGPQRRLAKAPSAGRPTWSSKGRLIPSQGDLVKIDPANGHVLKYFGSTIDAVWGLDRVRSRPTTSRLTYIGAAPPEPGDRNAAGGTVPALRALYGESPARAGGRGRWRTSGRGRSHPMARNSPSLRRHWYSPPSLGAVAPAPRDGRGTRVVAGPRPRFGERVEADSAEAAGRAGEVLVDELLAQPDGLEDLPPVYDATVEMPIFDITLSTPLPAALM